MSARIGLFTGSFDPLTNGHMDVIVRASGLFDRLYIGVFSNPKKQGLFSPTKRRDMLLRLFAAYPTIEVVLAEDELVVDVARRFGVTHLVRGLRNGADLEYEASFDFYNRRLAPELETVYLLARPEYKFVSSSQVRELLLFGQDISCYVPESIKEEIQSYEKP